MSLHDADSAGTRTVGVCVTPQERTELQRLAEEMEIHYRAFVGKASDPEHDFPHAHDGAVIALAVNVRCLAAERDELRAEVQRMQRLPEQEWAGVCAIITQVLAASARAGFPVKDTDAVAALDRGKVYVDRILAQSDELRAENERLNKHKGHEQEVVCLLCAGKYKQAHVPPEDDE